MSMDNDVTQQDIDRFLAAAHAAVEEVPYGWLATRSADGGTNARAVRVNAGLPGSDPWLRRFIVRRSSRKVSEMREAPRITLAFQHDAGDRFIALGGVATLIEDRAEMRTMWPDAANERFPPGFADANMIVVHVHVDRIELHVRGVTREPFGHGRTLLERNGDGGWHYVPY